MITLMAASLMESSITGSTFPLTQCSGCFSMNMTLPKNLPLLRLSFGTLLLLESIVNQ